MKRLLILMLIIASCGKKEDDEMPLNTFRIGGTSYTAAYYTATPFWAVAAGQQGVAFKFNNRLHPAGSYRISYPRDTGADCLYVGVDVPNGSAVKTYYTTGSDRQKLEVTYDGGRMFIRMPKVWAKYQYSPTSPADSFEVSAYLKEWL